MEFYYKNPNTEPQPNSLNLSPKAVEALAKKAIGKTDADKLIEQDWGERFGGLASTRHAEMKQLINNLWSSETNIQMPDIGDFAERAEALEPAFDYMQQKGWEPDVVFVPQTFNFELWDDLLTDLTLADGTQSMGVYIGSGINDQSLEPSSRQNLDVGPWDMVVISTTEKPSFDNVSPDGLAGTNKDATLSALNDMTDNLAIPPPFFSPEHLIREYSPSCSAYLAIQYTRLHRGDPPIDGTTTSSLLKEDINIFRGMYPSNQTRAVFGIWCLRDMNPGTWHVEIFPDFKTKSEDNWGVRPTVSANHLFYLASP